MDIRRGNESYHYEKFCTEVVASTIIQLSKTITTRNKLTTEKLNQQ